jgi:hypothetical protein
MTVRITFIDGETAFVDGNLGEVQSKLTGGDVWVRLTQDDGQDQIVVAPQHIIRLEPGEISGGGIDFG